MSESPTVVSPRLLTPLALTLSCFYPIVEGDGSQTMATGTSGGTMSAETTMSGGTTSHVATATTSSATNEPTSTGETTTSSPEETASVVSAESSTTSSPGCGDGTLADGEECDDGNLDGSDGCASDCRKEYRRTFATAATLPGMLAQTSVADSTCQEEAEAAGLPGLYLAWFASGRSGPQDTFIRSDVPYLRVDGVQVAANWSALVSGELEAPIALNAAGGTPGAGAHSCNPADATIAWTNLTETGLVESETCIEGSPDLLAGRVSATAFDWSYFCKATCDSIAALYCFEQ